MISNRRALPSARQRDAPETQAATGCCGQDAEEVLVTVLLLQVGHTPLCVVVRYGRRIECVLLVLSAVSACASARLHVAVLIRQSLFFLVFTSVLCVFTDYRLDASLAALTSPNCARHESCRRWRCACACISDSNYSSALVRWHHGTCTATTTHCN